MFKSLKISSVLLAVFLVSGFTALAPLQADAAVKTRTSVSSVKSAKAVASKKSIAPKKAKSSAPAKKAAKDSASCVIKGNISDKKEKIYHLPGCPNYNQTIIDTGKGERMFCNEKEAADAGWRKSLNCKK